jgi:1-acyl-sn-glycerol-3-phosphate acyltransferase
MDMWLYHLISGLQPLWWLWWRLRLVGEVDTIPKKGPLLVAANHACFLDPWFICILFPRPVRFLITRNWYYKSKGWQRFFAAQGTTPVRETTEQTLDAVREHMSLDHVVGVFPEGKISHDGRMQKFRAGIGYMAAQTGAPVVPIGIRGAYESLNRRRRFPRPSRVTLVVGRPMVFPGSPCEKPSGRELVEFRNRLDREIRRLAGQEHPAPGYAPAGGGGVSERLAAEASTPADPVSR